MDGLVFPTAGKPPAAGDAGRSTSALARAVVSDALRAVDPVGSRAASAETNWRHGYVGHFRRVLEAGLTSREAAVTIAADGLASLHERMRFVRPDGEEVPLSEVMTGGVMNGRVITGDEASLATVTVAGEGTVDRDISVPYRGMRLRGDALARQLDTWVTAGVIEPSCADAVRAVIANPDWLDLTDQRIVVLGAGAEMGPTQSLLRWGADVVAVDLPRPAVWSRLLDINRRSGGRLHIPVRAESMGQTLVDRAGADLVHGLPDVATWLLGIGARSSDAGSSGAGSTHGGSVHGGSADGRLVLGNYVYADGATNVRVSMAVDVLSAYLCAQRPDTALAFLATPTDTFAVPSDAVDQAIRAYDRRTTISRVRRPLRVLSAGRLLRRNYAPGSGSTVSDHGASDDTVSNPDISNPGICDSLVPQQGPNYALAKRLQRWRATTARASGTTVSFKVAPPTRTRSVLKNRALAAAYAGAHIFDVEVFEPATSNTLMTILLVHDLRNPTAVEPREHPWLDEAYGAAHGGLWRAPYTPRSALGLAALLGLGGARA